MAASKRKRVPMIMATGEPPTPKDDYVLDANEANDFMLDLELIELERLRSEVVPGLQRAVTEYHRAMKEWEAHANDLAAYVAYLEQMIDEIGMTDAED